LGSETLALPPATSSSTSTSTSTSTSLPAGIPCRSRGRRWWAFSRLQRLLWGEGEAWHGPPAMASATARSRRSDVPKAWSKMDRTQCFPCHRVVSWVQQHYDVRFYTVLAFSVWWCFCPLCSSISTGLLRRFWYSQECGCGRKLQLCLVSYVVVDSSVLVVLRFQSNRPLSIVQR
jgi:hypothetical protein